MKESSGTLLYRRRDGQLEVLIVEPSGPAARYGWSIPKGTPEAGETLEEAARRETKEEAGVDAVDLVPIGHVDYTKSKKRVHVFAGAVPLEATPNSACWEVSDAAFVPIERARKLLHRDQEVLLDRLFELLGEA